MVNIVQYLRTILVFKFKGINYKTLDIILKAIIHADNKTSIRSQMNFFHPYMHLRTDTCGNLLSAI